MSLTPVRNKQENAINKSRGRPPGTLGGPGPSADARASQCTGRAHAAAPSALDSRTFETLPHASLHPEPTPCTEGIYLKAVISKVRTKESPG